MKSFLFLIAVLFLFSCQFFAETKDDEVARVGEKYLSLSTIVDITKDLNKEDSLRVAQNYIDNWIKEELLIQKAIQNLGEEQLEFEQQLEAYKNSLIIYAYENELIRQKLDTMVTQHQIEEYYENNKENFILREDIISCQLIKCKLSAPQQDSIKFWINDDETESNEKLQNYCVQFTMRCHLDIEQWMTLKALKDLMPKGVEETNLSLINDGYSNYQDTLESLHLNLINLKRSGDLAPISYVRYQIIDIIRNKRKLELLSNARNEIFEEGTLKKKYEIYN